MTGRRWISTGSTFEEDLGYARAVVQEPWCFLAGITGYDYDSMILPDGADAQVRASFRTVARFLAEAGFDLADIVRVVHYVARHDLVDVVAPVIGETLRPIRPAATMVVSPLMDPNMLYEVEVTALRRV